MTKAQRHKVIYFDSVGGASGDMILAGLLDLGADLGKIQAELKKLVKDHFSIEAKSVRQNGMRGLRVRVNLPHHHNQRGHEHQHPPSLKLRRVPQRLIPSVSDYHGMLHRNLDDIEKLINKSQLSSPVKEHAVGVFRRLAQAEAKVHGVKLTEIHFHEVGALDSIIDIAGSCIALEQIGAERVVVGPLPIGCGTIKCAHGILPSPAPATVELLKGFTVEQTQEKFELVTPTGAALLTTWKNIDFVPAGAKLERAGYGFGHFELKSRPNLLRAIIFDCDAARQSRNQMRFVSCHSRAYSADLPSPTEAGFAKAGAKLLAAKAGSNRESRIRNWIPIFMGMTEGTGPLQKLPMGNVSSTVQAGTEACLVLECNLDDMNPELIGNLSERLFVKGALDVFITPVQMKKNRPGAMLTVLCPPNKRNEMLDLVFRESTTFGVREYNVQRTVLPRRFETVKTPYGKVRVKIGSWKGKEITRAPEYKDCRKLAEKAAVPLRKIYEAALASRKCRMQN